MPASTMTRSSSSEFRVSTDGKCSTSGRLTVTASCKQPAAQLPALAGLTRLPARLAKLLIKPQPTRLTQQPSVSVPQIDSAGSNPCSSSSSDTLHCSAIPSGNSSSSCSSFSSAASNTHRGLQATPHPAHTEPATDEPSDCTGSWPMLHQAAAASFSQGAHKPMPALPPSRGPHADDIASCGASTPSSSGRLSDAGVADRTRDHSCVYHRGLQQPQQGAAVMAPNSPRICMYITELGCGCTDAASCWAAGHTRVPSLSGTTAGSDATGTEEAVAAAAASACRSVSTTGGHSHDAAVARHQSGGEAVLQLPSGVRRASCSDCPQAFDPSMGDLALLECPLVQSLMLNTL